MSSKRPLSYPNWECVIKYMNSDARVLLSQHCPELRRLEKSIPLKVRYFNFRCQQAIFLNDSVYQVGIISQYHDEKYIITDDIQYHNNNGGLTHDVDKYGFPVAPWYFRRDDDNNLQKQKKEIQNRIEQLKEQLPGSADVLENAVKELKHLNNIIFRRDLQSKNLEPPFTHYLQLTIIPMSLLANYPITSRINGTTRTERLVYEQPLENAQKYLIDKLFGGRSQIFVGHMGLSDNDHHFPMGSLLRVQNLTIGSRSFVQYQDKVESVLEYKNYPLETLSLTGEELNHPIAETAKKLLFTGLPSGFPVIRHGNVEFSGYFDSGYFTTSVQQLVQHMLSIKTRIGVCYAFISFFKIKKTELIEKIKETHEEQVKLVVKTRNDTFSSCVVLQLTETSDLFVYWANGTIKIEVLPSGSPVPIEND